MRRIFFLCLMIIGLLFTNGCTKDDIIIHFEVNGGTEIEDLNVKAFDINNVPVPVKNGFVFVGWYLDESLTNPLGKTLVLNESITLYAKYSVDIFTLYFESNGGTEIEPMTTSFLSSSLPIPNDPIKEHYTFAGWYLEANFETRYLFNLPIIRDMTLYAKWIPISYTMIFNTNGGSAVSSISRTVEQSSIIRPVDPTKAGYEFAGWYLNETLSELYTFTTPINEDVTLYAKWTLIQYTMTFESNGGSAVSSISRTVEQSSIIRPVDPTKAGYEFAGWYLDETLSELYTFTTPINENVTLYAKWEEIISSVTLTFETNGGSVLLPITGTPGSPITLGQTSRLGYVFSGWYRGIDEIDFVDLQEYPDTSMTLYADWSSLGLIFEAINADTAYEVSFELDIEDALHIMIPKRYLGKPVTRIKESGFKDAYSIVSVRIPITVKTISDRAFMDANELKDVYLPSSLETLGTAVFRHCYSLEAFHMSSEGTHFSVLNDILFSKDLETLWRYPQMKAGTSYQVPSHVRIIEEDAFSSAVLLTNLDLGTGVIELKSHAFYRMTSLLSLTIPSQVTTVGIYLFRECTALETVTINNGLNAISAYMFEGCSSLTSIVIPYSVLSIGYSAFYSCSRLAKIYILRASINGLITGGIFMFSYTASNLQIYFPDITTKDAYKVASNWSGYASKMVVGEPS